MCTSKFTSVASLPQPFSNKLRDNLTVMKDHLPSSCGGSINPLCVLTAWKPYSKPNTHMTASTNHQITWHCEWIIFSLAKKTRIQSWLNIMSWVSLAAPFNCPSPKTHQNIVNFTHTRLVNHVALFANRTMNQRKQEKKEIRVYKAGYRYL